MDDDLRVQYLKEKEIRRLTTPLTYKNGKAYDCEGTHTIGGVIEPKKGILTDDEILLYAGESKEASRIRLKRGIGDKSDKWNIHGSDLTLIIVFGGIFLFCIGPGSFLGDFFIGKVIFLVTLNIMVVNHVYKIYLKDYTDPEYKQDEEEDNMMKEDNKIESSSNDDLLLLFESKEKIAREMIEKRFPAPQLTNIKFNAVLDNCKDVVESQIENLNALTLTEKTKYEIESRKQLIKQVIRKIDDLTNELILSEQNDIENVIDEMDDLINSINEYK